MDGREPSSSRIARIVGAVLTMVVAFGCASLRGAPDFPATTTLEESDPHYAHALKAYHDAKDPDARKSIRDAFIETRVGQMDRAYGEYKQTIYSQRVGSAVGVDIATLALSAVGAAVSEAGTKTITSALSGGLIGSKASIDRNVYFGRTLPALLAQMDGMRAQLRAQLLDGMLVGTERYPLM